MFIGSAEKRAQFGAVTQAMFNISALDSNIRPFCANLMKHMVRPCVVTPRAHVAAAEKSGMSISVSEVHGCRSDGPWGTGDTLEAFKHLKVGLFL